ncbi:stigma-specific STIG1 protein [Salix suchowensis]|nr:stigma-specific STIG1 protein [Salix suchowensis]
MKLILNALFLLAIFMPSAISLSATPSEEESSFDFSNNEDEENLDFPWLQSQETTSSLRGANRFLAQKTRAVMTCNKYPRVCRAKGSPGPDCCKKKCVSVLTDGHVVQCDVGKKCKYPEICCKGKCVNPMSDKKNCGGCSNKCKKGSACVYGMCSYA